MSWHLRSRIGKIAHIEQAPWNARIILVPRGRGPFGQHQESRPRGWWVEARSPDSWC